MSRINEIQTAIDHADYITREHKLELRAHIHKIIEQRDQAWKELLGLTQIQDWMREVNVTSYDKYKSVLTERLENARTLLRDAGLLPIKESK